MTKAIILAAGQGTRLRPITNNLPKCLVPLGGTSLLERQASTLRRAGVEDLLVVGGYCYEKIESLGFKVALNSRFEETNMVESLFCAEAFMKECSDNEEDLIIAYGDIVYNKENLVSLLDSREAISIMVDRKWKDLWSLRLENPLEDAETLKLSENNYILELGKKPLNYESIDGQYTGLIKIKHDRIDNLIKYYKSMERDRTYDGKDFSNMYMTSFIQQLIDDGWGVKAVMVENGWLEVDSVDDLKTYEAMIKDGQIDKFFKVGN